MGYGRRRRRPRHWHDPEWIEGQAERDAQLGRNRFFVYVLDTDFGHYVGHTWDVGSRLRAHRSGDVPSTRGGNPVLLWQSRPFATRADAASFEASLKSLRDQRSERYYEIVGFEPEPFKTLSSRAAPARGGCFLLISLALVSGLLAAALATLA